MLFNSFDFLFFFPLVVVVYYALGHSYRWIWLLLCSYFFYMYLEPGLILLLLASTLLDYFCGLGMEGEARIGRRKIFLWCSIVGNLGMLFFFKYFAFFTESSRELLAYFGVDWMERQETGNYVFNRILLPVGISFYTFQTLSYSIDVYKGEIPAMRHFGKYALYVAFFPQLVAGPIERAGRLLPQFEQKIALDLERIRIGISMMAWGFFLKLVAADRLGVYVDEVFLDPQQHRGLPLLIGSLFFSFQIYFDFSAYCTIAVGAAKVLGYDLMQNFNRPIFMKSFSDFWRKWHISLMLWFRDYLYNPLIEKFGMPRVLAAMLVFLCNGLWHGANLTFLFWGFLCGLMMVIEVGTKSWRNALWAFLKIPVESRLWKVVTGLFVFMILNFSLVFFRSPNIIHAFQYLRNMFRWPSTFINVTYDVYEFLLSVLLILFVQTVHYYKGNSKAHEIISDRPLKLRWGFYLAFIFVIVFFSVNRQNNFIYFQF